MISQSYPHTTDLLRMQDEVTAWVKAKGWDQDERTYADAMCLLHSEISEALEAYRVHGMGRGIFYGGPTIQTWYELKDGEAYQLYKPEGIASEIADTLIRLLDDFDRFGVDIRAGLQRFFHSHMWPDGPISIHDVQIESCVWWDDQREENEYFRENCKTVGGSLLQLHDSITTCARVYGMKDFGHTLVLTSLLDFAYRYKIDIASEFRWKMDYNWTRTHRHGGKLL